MIGDGERDTHSLFDAQRVVAEYGRLFGMM